MKSERMLVTFQEMLPSKHKWFFLVDIEGPARPNFQTISVISSDIYSNDAFTADPRPVVTFAGESGQGLLFMGPKVLFQIPCTP